MSKTNYEQQVRDLRRQVETAQHDERLYRQLIEESACGILVTDAQANCLEVNRVTCEMLGYLSDELIGMHVTELVVAEDLAANPPDLDELRAGNVVRSQRPLRHKDGYTVWVEARARMLADNRFAAILRDVTEHKRMEAVQQASLTLTASLDLRQVLDAILDAVLRLVPAEDTHIFLFRADRLTFGAAMARAGRLDQPATQIRSNGLTYTVARTGRPIAIEHPDQNPFPGGAPPNRPGAIVGLPMMIGATVVGVMNVYYPAPRRIPEAEIHVLSLLSAQAAIAVENARLYEETQRRVHELATLFQSSQAMSATLDLPTVLRQVVEQLAVAVDATSGYLLACDMKSRTATAQAEYYSPQANDLERVSDLGAEYDLTTMPRILQALREGRAAITRISDPQADPVARAELEKYGSKSGLSVPLITSGQARGYAVLWDSRDERMWSEAEVRLCQTLANLAAVAIENAQLHDTIRRHSLELEQRVAERTAELERERSRLQAILDSAGEGVEIQDRDGKILYINPAGERITGYSAVELIGQAPSQILRTEHTPPLVIEDLERAFAQGRPWSGEVINRRKDGTPYDAALTLTPIKNENGEVTGYVGVQHDITRLKELDRLKNQFVSRIGHELRTPLANIKLHVDLLERGKPDKREQYMQVLRRETARLRRLIEGFLEMSQLDAGITPIDLAASDVNQLAAAVITRHSAQAAERGLVLDFQPRFDLPPALVDPNLLTSVMSHIVENAVNYTPRDGSVTVITEVQRQNDEDWIAFVVQDTGPGLSADDQAHLFERFYRGSAARSFTVPGAGLGLPICKAIVDRLGGRITLDSQPGAGTTFTVWIGPAG